MHFSDSCATLLYLPTQIHFPIGGGYVTCHGSKLTNSLGRTKLTNSQGRQLLWTGSRGLARDQVVHLETAANLYASRPDAKKQLKSATFLTREGIHYSRKGIYKEENLNILCLQAFNLSPKLGRPRSAIAVPKFNRELGRVSNFNQSIN